MNAPEKPAPSPPPTAPHKRRTRLAFAFIGLIAFAALFVIVLEFGEISAFSAQAIQAEPVWLGFAALSQMAAFFLVAFVWWLVLRRIGQPLSLLRLFPLSVAKLFADQALPSGGNQVPPLSFMHWGDGA